MIRGGLAYNKTVVLKVGPYPTADSCLEECRHWNRGGKVACEFDTNKRTCMILNRDNVAGGQGDQNVICWSLTGDRTPRI